MVRPVTVLAGVGVVLVILLAPYLRPWLAQRSDIAAQQAEVEELQRQVDQLQAERRRWTDPAYVKAQARERLNFVMPGELAYVVIDDDEQAPEADPARQAALDAGRIGGRPWYDVLWQSVQLAGRSPVATGGTSSSTPMSSTPNGPAPTPASGTRTGPAPSTSRTP